MNNTYFPASLALDLIDLGLTAYDRTISTSMRVYQVLTSAKAKTIYHTIYESLWLAGLATYAFVVALLQLTDEWIQSCMEKEVELNQEPEVPQEEVSEPQITTEERIQRFDDLLFISLTEAIRVAGFPEYAAIADESHIPSEWLQTKTGKPLTGKVKAQRIEKIKSGWMPATTQVK